MTAADIYFFITLFAWLAIIGGMSCAGFIAGRAWEKNKRIDAAIPFDQLLPLTDQNPRETSKIQGDGMSVPESVSKILAQSDRYYSWHGVKPAEGEVHAIDQDKAFFANIRKEKRVPKSRVMKGPTPETVRARKEAEEIKRAEADQQIAKRESGVFVR